MTSSEWMFWWLVLVFVITLVDTMRPRLGRMRGDIVFLAIIFTVAAFAYHAGEAGVLS